MAEYNRQNLVYEKKDFLMDGQGKYEGYNYYKVAGLAAGVKGKGEGDNEQKPVDVKSLLP
jgi:NADH-quinone oxidoreductase subunit I